MSPRSPNSLPAACEADTESDDLAPGVDESPVDDELVDELVVEDQDDDDGDDDFEIEVDSEVDEDFDEEFDFGETDGEDGQNDALEAAFDEALQGDASPADAADAVAADSSGEGDSIDDGIELRADQRSSIDVAFEGIESKNYYEVLLVPRHADARSIKRSYYRLSKEYHPDKYYRKEIGPYKERLELIFNLISDAYRTLSDDASRREYDAKVYGKDRSESSHGSEASATVDFVPDALRKRRASRKANQVSGGGKPAPKKKGPPPVFIQKLQGQLAERIAKARKHMEEGKVAMEQQRFAEAASNFQLAGTLDTRNKEAKRLFKQAQSQHRNLKAEDFYTKGQEALLAEDTKRAAQFFQQAVDCKPTRGKYYNEFGKLITTNTLQQRVGLELLKKAVEAEPRSVEYTLDLATAYAELAMPSNAVRAFERVLHLDPKNSKAAKALRRLK